MKKITDPAFKYVPSHETDIRKTFRKERDRLRDEAKKREQNAEEVKLKVKLLPGSARST